MSAESSDMYEDEISKPATGYYFPHPAAELIRRIRELEYEIGYGTPSCGRLSLILKNSNVICQSGYQLASFYREGYIASFSLPDNIPAALGKMALERSLEEFHRIDSSKHLTLPTQTYVIYRSYLAPLGLLSITSDVIQGGNHWYLQYRKAASISKGQLQRKHERTLSQVRLG